MNPKATPKYSAFASSLTPDQRSYIQSYTLSAINELVAPLITESMRLTQQYKMLIDQIATLQVRVDSYESKFRDDSKYILTRAKIVALMKEQGIK